jgi:hypothetical protein
MIVGSGEGKSTGFVHPPDAKWSEILSFYCSMLVLINCRPFTATRSAKKVHGQVIRGYAGCQDNENKRCRHKRNLITLFGSN